MQFQPLKVLNLPRRLASWALTAVALLWVLGLLACALVLVGVPVLLAVLIAPAKVKPTTPGKPGLLVLLMDRAKEAMEEKQPRPEVAGAADESAEVLGYVGHQGISPPDDDDQRPS